MRKFDAQKLVPGLTPMQVARTNETFQRFICQNIDWIAYQAHRTQDQSYVDSHVGNYRRAALSEAHYGE